MRKVIFVTLFVVSVILNIYLSSQQLPNKRIEEDKYLSSLQLPNEVAGENRQLWGTTDCIPDGETAKKVADIIIETHSMFEDSELGYSVDTRYDEIRNEWVVSYNPVHEQGYIYEGGEIEFRIKRDSGMVTALGVYL